MTRADDSRVYPANSSPPKISKLIIIYIGAAGVEKKKEGK